jgi:hypothetical protein
MSLEYLSVVMARLDRAIFASQRGLGDKPGHDELKGRKTTS